MTEPIPPFSFDLPSERYTPEQNRLVQTERNKAQQLAEQLAQAANPQDLVAGLSAIPDWFVSCSPITLERTARAEGINVRRIVQSAIDAAARLIGRDPTATTPIVDGLVRLCKPTSPLPAATILENHVATDLIEIAHAFSSRAWIADRLKTHTSPGSKHKPTVRVVTPARHSLEHPERVVHILLALTDRGVIPPATWFRGLTHTASFAFLEGTYSRLLAEKPITNRFIDRQQSAWPNALTRVSVGAVGERLDSPHRHAGNVATITTWLQQQTGGERLPLWGEILTLANTVTDAINSNSNIQRTLGGPLSPLPQDSLISLPQAIARILYITRPRSSTAASRQQRHEDSIYIGVIDTITQARLGPRRLDLSRGDLITLLPSSSRLTITSVMQALQLQPYSQSGEVLIAQRRAELAAHPANSTMFSTG